MTLERELTRSLKQALRYIEVQQAYRGCMTAAEVEESIKRSQNVACLQIAANSCTTLASFDVQRAKEALKRAESEAA